MSKDWYTRMSEQKTSNREQFPETARIVDEFRRVFGADQVGLIWAVEGGKMIGKVPDDVKKGIEQCRTR